MTSPATTSLVLFCLAAALPAQTHQNPANGHLYSLTDEMTWPQAEAVAMSMGGHLATVRSQAEQDWLDATFGPADLWIGINDESVEGVFVWSSGEPVTYTNWLPGQPNNLNNEDYTRSNSGGWNDLDATVERRGIVEVIPMNPSNGHLYALTPLMTWTEAEAEAVRLGGHLATVRNQAEQDWLDATFGTTALWIGLNDEAIEGVFVWTSGEPVTYTNWNPPQPSNTGGNEHFVRTGADGWNDLDATLMKQGIVELLPRNPANGHVYALTPSLTWTEAEAEAVLLGGHLVTVRSQAEQDWLESTFAPLGNRPLWIGFNDVVVEGFFVWSSGEPVTYTNWNPPQPTNSGGNEDFVVNGPSGWNDLNASFMNLGIAELFSVAGYTPFGAGCAGTGGLPALAAAPGDLPRVNETFTVQLSNLPVGSDTAFVVFGFSDTFWAGPNISLPLNLTPFGLSGCAQFVSNDAAFATPAAGGTAQFSVAIPNDPSLAGLQFYNQALVLDPGANPAGAVVTNPAQGVIGGP